MNEKNLVEELLGRADIHTDGARGWDIQIKDERFYTRVVAEHSLGLGEAYMDGWWECAELDVFFYKLLRAGCVGDLRVSMKAVLPYLRARLFNLQSPARASQVAHAHYDVGNALFEHMLDDRMVYSCGYWADAKTLDEAQTAKLDMICRKVRLQPGMRILDIGCGWGGFAEYAARHYGVEVVGLTVSQEQAKLARERCASLPVDIRIQDYRECTEQFDAIVSVGMFEHVGPKNYATYLDVTRRCLVDDGLLLLHTIGSGETVAVPDRWITRYIFPNGHLPSVTQISKAAEGMFLFEDVHNFGADYDKTLLVWHRNFTAAWPQLKNDYDERFFRMWTYYLLSCAGAFRARDIQLWQFVMSKHGVLGGYKRPAAQRVNVDHVTNARVE